MGTGHGGGLSPLPAGEGWVRVSAADLPAPPATHARLRLAPPHPNPLPAGEREHERKV